MTWPPLPLAPLVPDPERAALIAAVVAALTVEVGADATRDADRLERAATSAVEQVEICVDSPQTQWTVATLPARIMAGLVALAAGDLKRPGFALGLPGYDELDPAGVRAYGAIMAMIQPGTRRRLGIA